MILRLKRNRQREESARDAIIESIKSTGAFLHQLWCNHPPLLLMLLRYNLPKGQHLWLFTFELQHLQRYVLCVTETACCRMHACSAMHARIHTY